MSSFAAAVHQSSPASLRPSEKSSSSHNLHYRQVIAIYLAVQRVKVLLSVFAAFAVFLHRFYTFILSFCVCIPQLSSVSRSQAMQYKILSLIIESAHEISQFFHTLYGSLVYCFWRLHFSLRTTTVIGFRLIASGQLRREFVAYQTKVFYQS